TYENFGSRRAGVGRARVEHPDDDDEHGQSAEYFGDGGVERIGSERLRGRGSVCDLAGKIGGGRGGTDRGRWRQTRGGGSDPVRARRGFCEGQPRDAHSFRESLRESV